MVTPTRTLPSTSSHGSTFKSQTHKLEAMHFARVLVVVLTSTCFGVAFAKFAKRCRLHTCRHTTWVEKLNEAKSRQNDCMNCASNDDDNHDGVMAMIMVNGE